MTDPSSPTPTPSERVRSLQARLSSRVASVLGSDAAPTAAGAGDSTEGQYYTPAAPHDGEGNGDRREGGFFGVGPTMSARGSARPRLGSASSGSGRIELSSPRRKSPGVSRDGLMGPALPPGRRFCKT
eukprot:scaffold91465_cov37-Cyclotella_meneghiniana.AAC.5